MRNCTICVDNVLFIRIETVSAILQNNWCTRRKIKLIIIIIIIIIKSEIPIDLHYNVQGRIYCMVHN